MKMLNDLAEDSGNILDQAEDYLDRQSEIIKVRVAERMIVSVSDLVYLMAGGMFAIFASLMISVTIAIILSVLLNSWIWGFVITSVAFVLFGWAFIHFGKEKIRKPVTDVIIKAFLE